MMKRPDSKRRAPAPGGSSDDLPRPAIDHPTKKRRTSRATSPASDSPSAARLTLAPGRVDLLLPGTSAPPAAAALLLDDAVVSTAAPQPGTDGTRFALDLPPTRFGAVLRVMGLPDGRALAGPVWLDTRRAIVWRGWSQHLRTLSGTFDLAGDLIPADLAALPVRLLAGERLLGIALARPRPGDSSGGTWAFETTLPELPPLHETLLLAAEVAGMPVSETLSLSARDCGLAGYVDIRDEPFVQGWAADLSDPARSVTIRITAQGETIFEGPADDPRADLQELGIGGGRSAFRIPLPARRPHDVPLEVAVTTAEGSHLVGSPYRIAAPPPVVGYFDALEGPFAGGWAVNMRAPAEPLTIEAVCDGEVIGTGVADLFRGDVEKSGMPTARCGFRFLLDRPLPELFDRDIVVRVAGTDILLGGSPRRISQNSNIVRFLTRGATLPPTTRDRLMRRLSHEVRDTLVSIIVPVFNTRREWLMEAINSVLGQWTGNWELICVDDGSTEPHVAEVLAAAARHDRRIRVMRSPSNQGIARTTNYGLRAARGRYVAFMDHDDVIEPDAVYKLAKAAQDTGADLVYSDEAVTTDDVNSIIEVRARPAFSHDYYLAHPYFVHMVAVRTELAQQLGGWNDALPISADVDFILRVIERSATIAHVPSVLYRWRTHGTSTGHAKQSLVTDTMVGLLDQHLARMHLPATARPGLRYNEYRIDWEDDRGEVLIIIPTKNRVDLLQVAIDSIEATCAGENYRIVVIDHQSTDKKTVRYLAQLSGRHTVMPYEGSFNYARMNNLAVKQHGKGAKYIVFMNNDVEAREPGWLPRMRSLAARPDVGAVGCLLLYGDDRVQHAGVLVGFSGAADHAMKFQDAYLGKDARHPGYNCSLTATRDYSAVTAACMMVKRAAFRAVKGFDEKFAIGFNDTDLCLRVGDAGFKVIYDGQTVLYHHESATRTTTDEVEHPEDDARLRTRWRRFFTDGDPFYSPLLAPRGTDHTLRQDRGCKGRMRVRATHGVGRNGAGSVAEDDGAVVVANPASAARVLDRPTSVRHVDAGKKSSKRSAKALG